MFRSNKIEFSDLVHITEIPDLPDIFYEYYVFSIEVNGRDISYRVRRKEDAKDAGHLVNVQELMALSDEAGYQSCLRDLREAKAPGAQEPEKKVEASTSIDHVHCLKTMEIKNQNELDIQSFLIRCYSHGVVPEFLAKRARNVDLWLTAKRPSSILFPTRFENGFYLTPKEEDSLMPFLPQCIAETNKWDIRDEKGNIFVIPPAPYETPWKTSERRQSMLAGCRRSPYKYGQLAIAMAQWSKNLKPEVPVGKQGQKFDVKELIRKKNETSFRDKPMSLAERRLIKEKRKIRRRIYEATKSFSDNEGREKLDRLSQPQSSSSKFLKLADKFISSDSPELLAMGIKERIPLLTDFLNGLMSQPSRDLWLLQTKMRLKIFSGSVVIRSRLEKWIEGHKGSILKLENFMKNYGVSVT
jgi:hypothetical protein